MKASILLILISSICLNTTANTFKNLSAKFRQQLQTLYRFKKANPTAFSVFKHKYHKYSYNPKVRPLLATPAPIVTAFEIKDKQEQDQLKKEARKRHAILCKFFHNQLSIINEFYKNNNKIQLTEIKILTDGDYLSFCDNKTEIYDTPEETRIIDFSNYKLEISIQALPNNKQTKILEKDWKDLISLLNHLDSTFVSIAEYIN